MGRGQFSQEYFCIRHGPHCMRPAVPQLGRAGGTRGIARGIR
jgi:hypothetical protein